MLDIQADAERAADHGTDARPGTAGGTRDDDFDSTRGVFAATPAPGLR